MILRRLSQSLKTQNWTAIWIEFILLVAGVFLGIQVSNWNAARADDVRAKAYLARIEDNLNTDLQSIQRRDVFWRQVINYGNNAIRGFQADLGQMPSPAELCRTIFARLRIANVGSRCASGA